MAVIRGERARQLYARMQWREGAFSEQMTSVRADEVSTLEGRRAPGTAAVVDWLAVHVGGHAQPVQTALKKYR